MAATASTQPESAGTPNFLGSPPRRSRLSPIWQICAPLVTNQAMSLLALSKSVLARHSWFPVFSNARGVSLDPEAHQQLGAAILAASAGFWTGLALIVIICR